MNPGTAMMTNMTHRVRQTLVVMALAIPLTFSSAALAASRDDDEAVPDARLLGYQNPVNVGGGNAGTYIMTGILAVITCGILFKNANRSHLD